MANSVDPDQTAPTGQSDLGWHCLLRPISCNRLSVPIPVDSILIVFLLKCFPLKRQSRLQQTAFINNFFIVFQRK